MDTNKILSDEKSFKNFYNFKTIKINLICDKIVLQNFLSLFFPNLLLWFSRKTIISDSKVSKSTDAVHYNTSMHFTSLTTR